MAISIYTTEVQLNIELTKEYAERKAMHQRLSTYKPSQYGSVEEKNEMLRHSQEYLDNIIKQLDLTFLN